MEMEKSFYVVTVKPSYLKLTRAKMSLIEAAGDDPDNPAPKRMIVSLTQGGFGQDVVDEERQIKERFLEYLFLSSDVDLPRASDVFDDYFELERATEYIDLNEEL
jgi:hypothetical protein